VLHRLAQTTPSLVVQFGLNLVPELSHRPALPRQRRPGLHPAVHDLALSRLLDALLDIYARTEHARTRSIKGYVQLAKMMLWCSPRSSSSPP
jgi:miniconductance mechanosensitive channel